MDSYTSTEKLSNFVRSHRHQTKLLFWTLRPRTAPQRWKHSYTVRENLQCRVMGERAVRKLQSIHSSHFLDLKSQLSLTYFSSGIHHWPHSHSNSKSLSLFLLTWKLYSWTELYFLKKYYSLRSQRRNNPYNKSYKTNYLILPCLSFFIHKMGKIIVPPLLDSDK